MTDKAAPHSQQLLRIGFATLLLNACAAEVPRAGSERFIDGDGASCFDEFMDTDVLHGDLGTELFYDIDSDTTHLLECSCNDGQFVDCVYESASEAHEPQASNEPVAAHLQTDYAIYCEETSGDCSLVDARSAAVISGTLLIGGLSAKVIWGLYAAGVAAYGWHHRATLIEAAERIMSLRPSQFQDLWQSAFGGATSIGSYRYPAISGELVRNNCPPPQGPECQIPELVLRCSPAWSAAQRAQALQKVRALQAFQGSLWLAQVVSGNRRLGPCQNHRGRGVRDYLRNHPGPGSDYQIDHAIELQLGGSDTPGNLWPLDRSVNASFGSQLEKRLRPFKRRGCWGALIRSVRIEGC